MSKAIPVLSVLLAAAIGGGIFFYIKKTEGDSALASLQEHAAVLSNNLNELMAAKDELSKEKSRTEEKLKHSEDEHEKTLAKLQMVQQTKKSLQEERDKMVSDLQDEIADQRVKISQLNGVIKVKMDNKILFPSGEAEVSPEGLSILKRVASSFNRLKNKRIRIEGHTDNVPISTSRFKSNWELSSTRATNVLHVLLDNSEVKPKLFEVVGKGEFHPIAPNDTSENKALNRRIEILLTPIKKEN